MPLLNEKGRADDGEMSTFNNLEECATLEMVKEDTKRQAKDLK